MSKYSPFYCSYATAKKAWFMFHTFLHGCFCGSIRHETGRRPSPLLEAVLHPPLGHRSNGLWISASTLFITRSAEPVILCSLKQVFICINVCVKAVCCYIFCVCTVLYPHWGCCSISVNIFRLPLPAFSPPPPPHHLSVSPSSHLCLPTFSLTPAHPPPSPFLRLFPPSLILICFCFPLRFFWCKTVLWL